MCRLIGVFGMNFTENGGYTMSLLNQSWGITFFYVLCVAVTVLCIGYFMKQGWISGIHMPKVLRKYFSCFIPKNSIIQDNASYGIYDISTSFSEDEMRLTATHNHITGELTKLEEAELEEHRRQERAEAKRSMMTMNSIVRFYKIAVSIILYILFCRIEQV